METSSLTLWVILFCSACFIVDVRIGFAVSTIIVAIILACLIKRNMYASEGYGRRKQLECQQIKEMYQPYEAGSYAGYHEKKDYCGGEELDNDCWRYNANPFFTKTVVVNKDMKSINNALQGGQNPKTLIAPMIARPLYDLQWRSNDMIVPNRLNRQTNEALEQSGYLPQSCDPEGEENITAEVKFREDFEYSEPKYTAQNWSDEVDMANGYNPDQWQQAHFPANLPKGRCAMQPEFKGYNDKLFTQSVQPGVYYRNEVIEPVNNNIGISFNQEFLPRSISYDDKGDLTMIDHDPNFYKEVTPVLGEPIEPIESNVYDPRFTGYGTSYRGYNDDLTGQIRFAYDDVNAVRMPNYITRSKIDIHDWADKYGPVHTPQGLQEVRGKAQDAFLKDSLEHRNDLMTRLMRKRNAEMWQLRQAPKSGPVRMLRGGAGGK